MVNVTLESNLMVSSQVEKALTYVTNPFIHVRETYMCRDMCKDIPYDIVWVIEKLQNI